MNAYQGFSTFGEAAKRANLDRKHRELMMLMDYVVQAHEGRTPQPPEHYAEKLRAKGWELVRVSRDPAERVALTEPAPAPKSARPPLRPARVG